MEIQGEYKNTFGDIHDIQNNGWFEIRKNWVDKQASTGYGYDPKKLTFQNLIFKDEAQANDWNLKTKFVQGKRFCFFLCQWFIYFNESLYIGRKCAHGWF